jgi:hypothetical protein
MCENFSFEDYDDQEKQEIRHRVEKGIIESLDAIVDQMEYFTNL